MRRGLSPGFRGLVWERLLGGQGDAGEHTAGMGQGAGLPKTLAALQGAILCTRNL